MRLIHLLIVLTILQLVYSKSGSKRKNVCKKTRGSSGKLAPLNGDGPCVEIGKPSEFCSDENEIVKLEKIARCVSDSDKDETRRDGRAFGAMRSGCKPGQAQLTNGKCINADDIKYKMTWRK